jgi:hypothetical protein
MPMSGAMVRANVPVFGVASGYDFASYRVEYGEGSAPTTWHLLRSSTTPESRFDLDAIERSGDTPPSGNLAMWDTGLTSYVYLPSYHPRAAFDLKGTFTLRLVVTGRSGRQVEDRAVVTIADVVPNAWGGLVTSADGKVVLSVPEHAFRDGFRLVSFEPTEDFPPISAGRTIVGAVYRARETGEYFAKNAVLEIQEDAWTASGASPDMIGVYAFNPDTHVWEHLRSSRPAPSRFAADVSVLRPYYAVMASRLAGEGSIARPERDVERTRRPAVNPASEYLVNNTFEDGLGQWSNRGGVYGGQVTIDRGAAVDGGAALKVTNGTAGGSFAVTVIDSPFDARLYPTVRFDYAIGADVKTNFLVKVASRWYEIGFTDRERDFRWKRVNVAHIGDVPGVYRDNRWHTTGFDLRSLLRSATGETLVEEIVMAAWDAVGYMKLIPGPNNPGATFHLDNFSIARADEDSVPGFQPPPPWQKATVIDDFSQSRATNRLGGTTGTFAHGRATIDSVIVNTPSGDTALELSYGGNIGTNSGFDHSLSYAGWATQLGAIDCSRCETLSLRVRGSHGGERPNLYLSDGNFRWPVSVADYVNVTTDWQTATIPLDDFARFGVDLTHLAELQVVFEWQPMAGTVFLDEITLGPPPARPTTR